MQRACTARETTQLGGAFADKRGVMSKSASSTPPASGPVRPPSAPTALMRPHTTKGRAGRFAEVLGAGVVPSGEHAGPGRRRRAGSLEVADRPWLPAHGTGPEPPGGPHPRPGADAAVSPSRRDGRDAREPGDHDPDPRAPPDEPSPVDLAPFRPSPVLLRPPGAVAAPVPAERPDVAALVERIVVAMRIGTAGRGQAASFVLGGRALGEVQVELRLEDGRLRGVLRAPAARAAAARRVAEAARAALAARGLEVEALGVEIG